MEGLITALKELGHEVIIVGPAAMEREEFGAEAGLVGVLKRWLPRFAYELMEFAYAFFAYVRLWHAARVCHPDCLYERYNLYLPSGVWLKQQLNIPMLLEVNAPILDERRQHSGLSLIQLARWCEERTWRGADFVLPVTHVLASRIRQAGVPKSKIRVIANGINRGSLEKVATREEAKRSLGLAGKLVIGFTGFMREWHGLERVLRSVSFTSNDRHLLLVGDGPARPQLEQLILELGLESKVTITGVIGREQVLDYIAAFDIALQPGVVPYASPLKLFEYMALGSAIVAPASANIQEILTHGKNGLSFLPKTMMHSAPRWSGYARTLLCAIDSAGKPRPQFSKRALPGITTRAKSSSYSPPSEFTNPPTLLFRSRFTLEASLDMREKSGAIMQARCLMKNFADRQLQVSSATGPLVAGLALPAQSVH